MIASMLVLDTLCRLQPRHPWSSKLINSRFRRRPKDLKIIKLPEPYIMTLGKLEDTSYAKLPYMVQKLRAFVFPVTLLSVFATDVKYGIISIMRLVANRELIFSSHRCRSR